MLERTFLVAIVLASCSDVFSPAGAADGFIEIVAGADDRSVHWRELHSISVRSSGLEPGKQYNLDWSIECHECAGIDDGAEWSWQNSFHGSWTSTIKVDGGGGEEEEEEEEEEDPYTGEDPILHTGGCMMPDCSSPFAAFPHKGRLNFRISATLAPGSGGAEEGQKYRVEDEHVLEVNGDEYPRPELVFWDEQGGQGSLQALLHSAQELMVQLRGLAEERRYLLVSMGNAEFVPFFSSWICNTKYMQGVHERTLLIFSDLAGMRGLSSLHPDFAGRIVHVRSQGFDLSRNQKFHSIGYNLLMMQRNEVIGRVLRSGIGMLLFETDAVWARNPLSDPLLSGPGAADLTVFMNRVFPAGFGFGFTMLRSKAPVLLLWRQLEEEHAGQLRGFLDAAGSSTLQIDLGAELGIKGFKNEMAILEDKAKSFGASGRLRFKVLPTCSYLSGLWYDDRVENDEFEDWEKAEEGLVFRQLCREQNNGLPPYVLNNNWIVGLDAKMERAKRWGHWFTDEKDMCSDTDSLKADLRQMEESFSSLSPLFPPSSAVEAE